MHCVSELTSVCVIDMHPLSVGVTRALVFGQPSVSARVLFLAGCKVSLMSLTVELRWHDGGRCRLVFVLIGKTALLLGACHTA